MTIRFERENPKVVKNVDGTYVPDKTTYYTNSIMFTVRVDTQLLPPEVKIAPGWAEQLKPGGNYSIEGNILVGSDSITIFPISHHIHQPKGLHVRNNRFEKGLPVITYQGKDHERVYGKIYPSNETRPQTPGV